MCKKHVLLQNRRPISLGTFGGGEGKGRGEEEAECHPNDDTKVGPETCQRLEYSKMKAFIPLLYLPHPLQTHVEPKNLRTLSHISPIIACFVIIPRPTQICTMRESSRRQHIFLGDVAAWAWGNIVRVGAEATQLAPATPITLDFNKCQICIRRSLVSPRNPII
jgi:hypothetical protein